MTARRSQCRGRMQRPGPGWPLYVPTTSCPAPPTTRRLASPEYSLSTNYSDAQRKRRRPDGFDGEAVMAVWRRLVGQAIAHSVLDGARQRDEPVHRATNAPGPRAGTTSGLLLLVMSGVAMKWPRVVAIPLSVVLGWVALSLFSRAATLHVEGKGLRWPWRGGGPREPPTVSTSEVRACASTGDNGRRERSEASAEVDTWNRLRIPP